MKLALLTPTAALAVALVVASAPSSAPRNDHQVTSLPNFKDHDKLSFAHFAGQLQLDTSEKLFYWYAESQQDAAKDPIVLWLNGGPGCSSINGLFTENGPFVVDKDLSVKLNSYAWNRKANIVWVESPAGVGFSAPQQPAEYYNDDVVADRLHQFLTKFLAKYPELQHRDFYITGESYAGIYIPYLVNALVDKPIQGLSLKGFAIGNPLTDNEIDGNAYMDYYYNHALVSRQTYHQMLEACAHEIAQCTFSKANCSAPCQQALDQGYTSAAHGHFNAYNIYGDVCQLSNGQGASLRYKNQVNHPTATTHRGDVGPCADTFTYNYLNTPELQAAVHLDTPVQWVDCSPFISQHFTRADSSLPKYRNILGKGLKALIYSGDADSVVNFIGTERWITEDGLNLKELVPWQAWYGADKQIAGYEQVYEGLTFKTVKGAGHMVPAIKPLHGLQLFECFVYGNETCQTFKYPTDAFEIETGLVPAGADTKKDTGEAKKSHGKKQEKEAAEDGKKQKKDGKEKSESDKKEGGKKSDSAKKETDKKHKGDKEDDDEKDKSGKKESDKAGQKKDKSEKEKDSGKKDKKHKTEKEDDKEKDKSGKKESDESDGNKESDKSKGDKEDKEEKGDKKHKGDKKSDSDNKEDDNKADKSDKKEKAEKDKKDDKKHGSEKEKKPDSGKKDSEKKSDEKKADKSGKTDKKEDKKADGGKDEENKTSGKKDKSEGDRKDTNKKPEGEKKDKDHGSQEQLAAAVGGAAMNANVVSNENAGPSTVLLVMGAVFVGAAFFVQKRKNNKRRGYEAIPFASTV